MGIVLLSFSLGHAQSNQVFRYGDFGHPSTFDPLTATQPSEHRMCQFVFDSLIAQNLEGGFVLSLSKDLDISPDGLSYTFILRNVKWADGTPLTSKDIEFTLVLMLNAQSDNYNATLAKYIEDVVCIHPNMVTITLTRPFFSPLSLFTFKILPKHKFTSDVLQRGHPFTKSPVGCGPFQYSGEDHAPPNDITLEVNPMFAYRRKPFLQHIGIKFYSSKEKATQDLLQKKIDLVTEVYPGDLAELEKKQLVLAKYQSRAIYYVAFNYRPDHPYHALFRDYRFRRALLHAIDRQSILEKTFFSGNRKGQDGQAHFVISGPFPINSWAYNDKVKPFPFNLPYARQLAKESLSSKGYEQDSESFWKHPEQGRITLTLKYPPGDRAVEEACKEIADSFKKLGIMILLQPLEKKSLFEEVWIEHRFDLVYTKHVFDNTIDAFPLFDPARTGKGQTNFSGYVDSKLVELFFQLHNTLNPWVLRSLAHKIHKIIHDETIHLFLWQLDLYAAHHRKIKNMKVHPYHLFNFPEDWKVIED